MKKLSINLPPGFVRAVSRRHNGREDLTREQILEAVSKMTLLFSSWEKAQAHLDWVLDVFWEDERIEANYGRPKFYGAHRRLRNARAKVEKLHEAMFYLLVYTDGNYEPFNRGWSLDARSIFADFSEKYIKRLKK